MMTILWKWKNNDHDGDCDNNNQQIFQWALFIKNLSLFFQKERKKWKKNLVSLLLLSQQQKTSFNLTWHPEYHQNSTNQFESKSFWAQPVEDDQRPSEPITRLWPSRQNKAEQRMKTKGKYATSIVVRLENQ